MTDTRKWSALAVLLVAAIFAAGWFLLLSPKRGEAAELKEQSASQADANARLEQKLEILKVQQQDLPTQRAKLAALRHQIPDNPALPSLVRDLTKAGRETGVNIDAMAPAPPVALVAAVPTAVTPAAGTEASTTDTTDSTATAAAPATPARNLFQVPLTLNVTGSYFELEQFVNRLEELRRSFLVSGFTLAEATGDRPDATAGDLTIVITGRVFLSQPAPDTTTTPVAPAATTPAE